MAQANLRTDEGLVRGIGRASLVALFINSVIGAGIFGLPGRVHELLGPHALLAYLACAALVLLIVLCFAEVGGRFDRTAARTATHTPRSAQWWASRSAGWYG